MIFDSTSIAEATGLVVTALIFLAFSLQKMFKQWKESSTESSVLSLMHTELERMSKQNTILSQELGKLQVEILTLNSQLRFLTNENQRLHSEIVTLTSEVTRLQSFIAEYNNNLKVEQNDTTSKN